METHKALYFLHIPKTGGMTIGVGIARFLNRNGLAKYPPTPPPHPDVDEGYAFIQGHLGRYPISRVPNLTVATLVRDPLDRAISNFLYIYNRVLVNRPEYAAIEKMEDKLKFYLFDDVYYTAHRNIQSKFICSEPETNNFRNIPSDIEVDYRNRSKQWYLVDVDLSFDLVKSYIDSFEIVNTTNKVPVFLDRIITWFNQNYPNLSVKELEGGLTHINASLVEDNNQSYTTVDLKDKLTDEDIAKFLDLNSIDFELYEYVYNREVQENV
jgi:hypothetical protein